MISLKKRMGRHSAGHSIKHQMIAAFVGLLACMMLALLVINGNFLEPYYIRNKQTQFIDIYGKLNEAIEKGTLTDEKVANSLVHLAEKSNTSFLILDESSGTVFTNVYDKDMLKNQMFGYLLNQAQKDSKVLKSTDDYRISQSWDPWNQNYYIEMWGYLSTGNAFILRSPLESIRESAMISNQFLLYITLAIGCIGSVFVWFFTKKITDPLLELTKLSERMANLDFDAKYRSGGQNEIGVLGANFNTMSQKFRP